MQLHKFTRQTSIPVLATDFCGLGRKEIYSCNCPVIPFPRHLVEHCQKTELDQAFYILVFFTPEWHKWELRTAFSKRETKGECFTPRRQDVSLLVCCTRLLEQAR